MFLIAGLLKYEYAVLVVIDYTTSRTVGILHLHCGQAVHGPCEQYKRGTPILNKFVDIEFLPPLYHHDAPDAPLLLIRGAVRTARAFAL